ncbi:efflux RND transporter permease subunit [Stenotrophomonas maltophilia]|nr:efflux RND transporter permease subunit [Stenotrophomonas maltophilia]MBA0468560.1 efflux RND transporter permease subunit [Stenotrophomonas maltophilia]MBA0475395.1 efflux RND transporter permease subunit [Stenotrophomonas maltophilia]MBA0484881.1 efflux RND transporter permease subunit [Stenotrophomonas maltophilia]
MNFATWSIRNPIPSILLFVLLALAGLWGFQKLPTQDLPDLDLPMVTVALSQPGAAPAQLETEVARKVEDALATLTGLNHLTTSVTDGLVSIQVQFVLEKNLSDALIETKNAVDGIRSDLPPDMLQPTVSASNSVGAPVLTYAIASSRLNEEQLSWFVDDTVGKTVLGVSGVGRFERLGGIEREVRIEVDPLRMSALGITAADVSRALRQVQQQSSGGRGQLGGEEQSVRTIATVRQASELAGLRIALSNGKSFRLDQIATIVDGQAEPTHAALLDGEHVVGFSVYRARGFDEVRLAEGVREALAGLQQADPSLSLTEISGSIGQTLEQYEGSMAMLYEGAILAMIVVWLFLRDWRATLIASTALPLSILPAFAAMAWLGFTLNTVTLLALAVVVGILVDDAIVEIENIERHRHMGKSIREAAEDAVTEIALAVMATTMSLVVVFLPTAMMSGIGGLVFKQFGWTAVIAVLASLLVARLLTPMMAAYLLKPEPIPEKEDGRVMRWYMATARWCLKHRKTTLGGSVIFLAASLALVPFIETGFIPASDSGTTTVSIELPPGSSMDDTLAVAESARKAFGDVDGIAHAFVTVGNAQSDGPGGSRAGEVRRASLTLALGPRGDRPSQQAIEKAVRERLIDVPGARFAVGGSGPGQKLSIILASDNAEALKASADAVEAELRDVKGLTGIASTASLERPEIIIRPDPERAAERGVTTAAIGDVVRVATSGDFDAQVARLNLDNRQVYIRARIPDAARQDIDTIANMRVPGRDGSVPLGSVASLTVESGPAQIDRHDRLRNVTISADLGGTALGTAQAAAAKLPSIKSLPSSVKVIEAGDSEIVAELGGGFAMALVVGVLCIYCVLVLLFRDFLQPITILSAIPLSIGGAFLALLVTRSQLSVPSMIGLVMLMGIVTKNSILLVEYAVIGMRDRGLPVHEALLDACHKRARPIVMTTIAMIAGMLPIALGLGADSSFRRPMAMAVIGGLITSTALSLLVVPAVFLYVDRFEKWLASLGFFRHAERATAGAGGT